MKTLFTEMLTTIRAGVACCNAKCPPGSDGVSDKCDACDHHAKMIDKLAEYETALPPERMEQLKDIFEALNDGRLIVLPVRPGDPLYMPVNDEYEDMIHYTLNGAVHLAVDLPGYAGCHLIPLSVIGKTVFTTEEEAEERRATLYGKQQV